METGSIVLISPSLDSGATPRDNAHNDFPGALRLKPVQIRLRAYQVALSSGAAVKATWFQRPTSDMAGCWHPALFPKTSY